MNHPSASLQSLQTIPFGVVVLAEPGLPLDEMLRDLENIAQLGFNTIVLYPSVSRWEGTPPGQTAFQTIDRILDWCAALGLKVILELQGQVMQDADAPECFGFVQPENYRENGFHHPVKRELLRRYLTEVATHFRGHPALLAYDLFNEIGSHSRSPETILAFVESLKKQYVHIAELNRAWATYFADFDAIAALPPNYKIWSWSSVVAERDWLEFRSRDFVDQMAWWRAVVREIDPQTPLFVDVLGSDVLHNRTDAYFGVSDWEAVEQSDVLGLSCYANMLASDWWEKDAWLWPQFWRHARSVAGSKQTLISELMTPNRNLFPSEKSSLTDELKLWSYQAIFHGIHGLIYWKYRPFRRGRQVSGRGLTDFDGQPNGFAQQAAEVARFVQQQAHGLATAKPDDRGCAILFDPAAERLYSAIGIEPATFYTDTHRGWFKAFWTLGISPTYVHPREISRTLFEQIRVLAVPCLANVSDALARDLSHFVERGGILITESRFGILDPDGSLRAHSPELFENRGWKETGFSCRCNDSIQMDEAMLQFDGDHFQELTCTTDADVLLRTREGAPALVRNAHGKGAYFHLPFILGHQMEKIATAAGTQAFFTTLFESIRPALKPSVEVLTKSALMDVSTLLHPSGDAYLTGLCNYSHQSGRAILRLPDTCSLEKATDESAIARNPDGTFTCTLSPRSELCLFYQPSRES